MNKRRNNKKKVLILVSILLVLCIFGASGSLLLLHLRESLMTVIVSAPAGNENAAGLQDTEHEEENTGTEGIVEKTAGDPQSNDGNIISEMTAEKNVQSAENGAAQESPEETAEEDTVLPEPVKVRGIYVTGPMAGSASMESLIGLIDDDGI